MKKWIFLFFMIGALGAIVYFGFIKPNHTDCQLTTPYIVGLDVKEAETILTGRGMKITIIDTTYTPGIEARQIVNQLPLPGVINCDSVAVTINL